MASIPRRDIESSLSKKGFEVDEKRDHRFYYFTYKGKRTQIRTKISTGTGHREYGDPLLHAIQRQLKLTFREFQDLINCPMSQAQYEDRLKAQQLLT